MSEEPPWRSADGTPAQDDSSPEPPAAVAPLPAQKKTRKKRGEPNQYDRVVLEALDEGSSPAKLRKWLDKKGLTEQEIE